MEFRTLENVPVAVVADVFNRSFSDYSIPMVLTEEMMRFKMIAENIRPGTSAGAFADGKLVGLILNGVDEIDGEKRVFNAGTGVIPEYRGQQATEKMYGFIIPLLKQQGYKYHQLEVLRDNVRAKSVYEKVGFRDYRQLSCYKGAVDKPIAKGIEIREGEPDWSIVKNFWNIEPTWQNNIPTIQRSGDRCKTALAYLEGALAGYAVYDTVSRRIKQFAVRPDARGKGMGTALFSHVNKVTGQVMLTNYDESDAEAQAAFAAWGLEPQYPMYEMILKL